MPNPPSVEAEWWTTSDVAAYLGVRVATVSTYRKRGQMPEPEATVGRTHTCGGRRTSSSGTAAARALGSAAGRCPWTTTGRQPMLESVASVEQEPAAAAREACAQLGLPNADLQLIRVGTNAVYRLPTAELIVRVAPAGAAVEDVERQVAIARWLERNGVPAVRAYEVPQPVKADGRLVTFWESVNDASADDLDHYGTTRELGAILRQLHSIASPDFPLPPLRPAEQARERLARLRHLTAADRETLAEHVARLAAAYAELAPELELGWVHGDANVGNLLRATDGRAVLSDLDGFSIGLREWDLVLTAMYTELYGWHTEAGYGDFVDAYGWDIRQWSGYPVLRDLRELLMVLWLAGQAESNPRAAEEFAFRIETLRTGTGRDNWRPL